MGLESERKKRTYHWCMLEMLCEQRILRLRGHDDSCCDVEVMSSGAWVNLIDRMSVKWPRFVYATEADCGDGDKIRSLGAYPARCTRDMPQVRMETHPNA